MEDKIITADVPEVASGSPAALILQAVNNGADLEKLKGLLDLQERWEANQARKAYNEAMSAFKSNPPKIDKDRKVSYGNTKYNHASLYNVCDKINEALSKHGLFASWTTKQDNGTITVTCRITHVAGHSEETSLTASPDSSGSKNSIQAIGSTISYLERYSLLSLTGLATYDQDDDSRSSDEYITEKQKGQLVDMIADCGADSVKFCTFMKVDSLDEIPASKFENAVTALKNKKKKLEDEKKKKAVKK
jgi:hypothetical protein